MATSSMNESEKELVKAINGGEFRLITNARFYLDV
jgi:hypothetical protein